MMGCEGLGITTQNIVAHSNTVTPGYPNTYVPYLYGEDKVHQDAARSGAGALQL